MRKIIVGFFIFILIFGLVGCKQIEKIQDTVEIGNTFNDWFSSLQGNEGSFIENMVENGDDILYDKNLKIKIKLDIAENDIIEINENFETKDELINFVKDKNNYPENWRKLTNYRLINTNDIIIKNKNGDEIDVDNTGLKDVQNIVSLVGAKQGNSRPLYANIELDLYNTEKEQKEDFSGYIRLLLTEDDGEWFVQEITINLE